MGLRYFKKENLRVKYFPNGMAVNFQPVDQNTGVIQLDETNDALLIAGLDAAADRRIGGIVRISAEIFDSLKKKLTASKPSLPRLELGGIRVSKNPTMFGRQNQKPKASVAAAAVGESVKLAPIAGEIRTIATQNPTGNFTPARIRLSEAKARAAQQTPE